MSYPVIKLQSIISGHFKYASQIQLRNILFAEEFDNSTSPCHIITNNCYQLPISKLHADTCIESNVHLSF